MEKKYFKIHIKASNVLTLRNFQQKFVPKSEYYEIILEDNAENRRFAMLLTRLSMREEVITDIGF